MNPYPKPNSVLVLDNASIHHDRHIANIVEACGCLLLHLPAYSPDLNPIEKGFSVLKSALWRNEDLLTGGEEDFDVIDEYIYTVFTSDMTKKLFRGSGYHWECIFPGDSCILSYLLLKLPLTWMCFWSHFLHITYRCFCYSISLILFRVFTHSFFILLLNQVHSFCLVSHLVITHLTSFVNLIHLLIMCNRYIYCFCALSQREKN